MSYQNPNQMIVEDEDIKGVVIGTMRHYLGGWSTKPEEWPIHIVVGNSADEVLKENGLVAGLQATGVKVLGIIVDANDKFRPRWERIRDFCRRNGGRAPDTCPEDGLVIDGVLGRRFGAWIMPNNKDGGMLENFCLELIFNNALWYYAQSTADNAKQFRAPYSDSHRHKAHIHTWLAWQDPPGERMGSAITKKILRPERGQAKIFAEWFRKLYGV